MRYYPTTLSIHCIPDRSLTFSFCFILLDAVLSNYIHCLFLLHLLFSFYLSIFLCLSYSLSLSFSLSHSFCISPSLFLSPPHSVSLSLSFHHFLLLILSLLRRMANSPLEVNADLANQPNALIIGRYLFILYLGLYHTSNYTYRIFNIAAISIHLSSSIMLY